VERPFILALDLPSRVPRLINRPNPPPQLSALHRTEPEHAAQGLSVRLEGDVLLPGDAELKIEIAALKRRAESTRESGA
ncbi:MAG: hypothetical protein QF886_21045, partial [Planctomycetota bacterium]|nr:hypothetical protein [Planctomycetota bacterium]